MIVRDGEWTLFDSDIREGKYIWKRVNDDGSITLRTDMVVDDVLDMNRAQRNIASPGWKGDWHHVAAVPTNVAWNTIVPASIQGDRRYMRKWLNDGDNRGWRTKEGRV